MDNTNSNEVDVACYRGMELCMPHAFCPAVMMPSMTSLALDADLRARNVDAVPDPVCHVTN